jgi:hypothetical protein
MTEEILSEWPVAQNGVFILFLFCFFISMHLLGAGRKLLSAMLYSLFREKDRQSIFSETVDNEMINKIVLCLQTIILIAVITYCTFTHGGYLKFETVSQLFWCLGGTSLLVIAFLVYKFTTNILISSIFFQKENVQLWNDNFFSIISLSGLILFIPALLMFYVPEAFYFCFYFCLAFFLFIEILTFYKIFIIFFQQKSILLYFILYLCAQELVPLYLSYKALVHFYIFM